MTMDLHNSDQMIGLLRNALLVAGQEMGDTGDHWPVINATVHSIMKTHEDLKIEEAVDAEMKKHLYKNLEDMEQRISEYPPKVQADVIPQLHELREVYDAYFSKVDAASIHHDDEETPAYLKRAAEILTTLGEEHV